MPNIITKRKEGKYEHNQALRKLDSKMIGSRHARDMTFKCGKCGGTKTWQQVVLLKGECRCITCMDVANN